MLFDSRDKCLQTSLYYFARIRTFRNNRYDLLVMNDMIESCRLNSLNPIKDPSYRWSRSGSQNKSENTLFKRPTYWIQKHILSKFGIDPLKGLSIDQLRGLFLVLYLCRHDDIYKKIWYKIFWGTILRGGLAPSLMEWCPAKPQAFVLFLKAAPKSLKWVLFPLYLFSKFIFKIRLNKEFLVPIHESTTNKIVALPTAKLLQLDNMPTDNYIREVYKEYFKNNPLGDLIAKSII